MKFFVLLFALFALALASPQWGGFEGIDQDQEQWGNREYQRSAQEAEYLGSRAHQQQQQVGAGYQYQHQQGGYRW